MRARGLGAVLALVLIGLILAAWPRRRHAGRSAEPGDAVVEQALRQAREGSGPAPSQRTGSSQRMSSSTGGEEDKSRWVSEVKGFDYSDLNRDRRTRFIRFANAERCTCGCGYTLAGCRTYDPSCPVSGPRVQALLDSVRAGLHVAPATVRRRHAGSG
jgi:hypothetical protein